MRSKTSFFNGAVYKRALTTYWPLWACYVLIWAFLLPVQLPNTLSWQGGAMAVRQLTMFAATGSSVALSAAFSAAAAMAVYSWLYNTRSTAFMCALPLRRETLFLSCMAAGLTLLLAGAATVFIITAVAEAALGVMALGALWQWLGMTALYMLCFFGFASFCAVLTGNLLVLPAVYVIFQFTVVALEETVRYLLRFLLFGMPSSGRTLDFLSPAYYLFREVQVEPVTVNTAQGYQEVVDYVFTRWGTLLLYALSGVALAALALLLFRRRRMEYASEVVAIPALKPAFRWCLALACALGLAACLFLYAISGRSVLGLRGAVFVLCFMLLGGFIGWFAADMLMTKTFRVFSLHWRGWLLFSGILCALVLACELDVVGYEKRLPDESRTAAVELYASGCETVWLEQEDDVRAALALQQSIVAHKGLHESVPEQGYPNYQQLALRYYDADGALLLSREYYLSREESQQRDGGSDLRQLEALINVRSAVAGRLIQDIAVTPDAISYAYVCHTDCVGDQWQDDLELTPDEAYELYTQCVLPDMADGTLGWFWLVRDDSYARAAYNVNFQFEVSLREAAGDYRYENYYIEPTVDSLRTNRWLLAHGVQLDTIWDCWQSYDNGDEYNDWKVAAES